MEEPSALEWIELLRLLQTFGPDSVQNGVGDDDIVDFSHLGGGRVVHRAAKGPRIVTNLHSYVCQSEHDPNRRGDLSERTDCFPRQCPLPVSEYTAYLWATTGPSTESTNLEPVSQGVQAHRGRTFG